MSDEIRSTRRVDWQLAVVVGAGGMGEAVARRLSQRYRILLADIDSGRADAVAAKLCQEGGDVTAIACDVTDPLAVSHMADVVRELGGFRALAHVAGLSPSMSDFATIMRVNLAGPARVAEALLPHAVPGAAAILISSFAAHAYRPTERIEALVTQPSRLQLVEDVSIELGLDAATPEAAYSISKFGILAYCRSMAAAWGERGARIISLSPGLIATPQGALEFDQRPSKLQLYRRTPLKREGSMLEIADVVEFLISDRASFISGSDILVDGGLAGALGLS